MPAVAAKPAPTPRQSLTAADVKHFLAKFKKAWETRDADLAAGLFTRDAQYKQDPFSEAIVGREAIHDYWAGATGRQDDIHFTVGAVIQSRLHSCCRMDLHLSGSLQRREKGACRHVLRRLLRQASTAFPRVLALAPPVM